MSENSDEYGRVDVFASAHISPDHINEIRRRIDEGDYDVVAIELGESRFERAAEGRLPTPTEVLEEMDGVNAVVYAVFAFIQQVQARSVGIEPGLSDMRAAMEAAALNETPVALIDRELDVTIQRLRDRVSITTLFEQMTNISPEVAAELRQVQTLGFDEMTDRENAERLVGAMRSAFPEVTEVLIDERDQYMAERLHRLRLDGKNVFAVVGAGHTPGLEEHLEDFHVTGHDPDVDVTVRHLRATGDDVSARNMQQDREEEHDER